MDCWPRPIKPSLTVLPEDAKDFSDGSMVRPAIPNADVPIKDRLEIPFEFCVVIVFKLKIRFE
jgi:hypothetical protein